MTDQLAPLTALAADATRATQSVRRLVDEAAVHYKRGRAIGASEYQAASRCFRDAWNLLRDLSCDEAQGFHMGKPMPASEFVHWAAGWATRFAAPGLKGMPDVNVTLH